MGVRVDGWRTGSNCRSRSRRRCAVSRSSRSTSPRRSSPARTTSPSAIHDARRCLKRLRALIRLVRPALGDAVYRRESRTRRQHRPAAGRRARCARHAPDRQPSWRAASARCPMAPANACSALLAANAAAIPSDAGKDGRAQALKRLKQTRKFFVGHALDDIGLSMRSPRAWSAATARAAGASATRSASRPTSPSTPGASPCSGIGGTCS